VPDTPGGLQEAKRGFQAHCGRRSAAVGCGRSEAELTAGGEVKDRQRNAVAAAYSGGNGVTKVELPHYGKPPYPADTEWSRLAVTELATGTGAEPRTQTRVETAGENLQNDAVQRMSKR